MEAIKVLEDVLVKTAKHTSNENRKRAVDALQTLFMESNDPKQVAEYIIKLHYSVCQAFFEEFCSSASDEIVLSLAEALVNDEQFKKSNPNNVMYPKGLSAVLALVSKGKLQAAFLVLIRILTQSEKSEGVFVGCVNIFKKLIVDKKGLPLILDLFEQVRRGDIVCKEFEQKRLARFLKALDDKVVVTSKEEILVAAQKTEPTQQAVTNSPQPTTFEATVKTKPDGVKNDAEAISKIEKSQQDIIVALRRLADSRSSIESLTSAIARRDTELSSIRADMLEKEHRASSLASEIVIKDKLLTEMKVQVDDLAERLRTSLQMDDISKSQELITLKNDISEALKLDYADFVKSKENPYSEDLFEAYRLTLSRIFKLLKRFGITCQ